MKDKLKDRVANFSKSLDNIHWLDRASHIENFLLEELNAIETEYTLTPQDFQTIKDFSVKEWGNGENVFKSTVLGTVAFLRSRDVLHCIIRGQRGQGDDSKPDNSN